MPIQKASTHAPSRTTTARPSAATKAAARVAAPTVKVADGAATAKINGKTYSIKDPNLTAMDKAFVLDGGRFVAVTGRDGAGGFENEGQSLRLFDTQTGKLTKVMAEYDMIDDVKLVKTPEGKPALLVGMSDGGLGGDHFALVDPARGQTFRLPMARVLELKGDRLTLGTFKEDDYSMADGPAKPSGKKSFSLSQLLARPVLENKPSF